MAAKKSSNRPAAARALNKKAMKRVKGGLAARVGAVKVRYDDESPKE